MRTKNFQLITIILLFLSSLQVWSQSKSADIVRTHYPEIYTSINQRAEAQWNNDPKIKQAVVEGQAKAFLDILNIASTSNSYLIREAVILNSYPNDKESNINILNSFSLQEAFPKLKCDWYKAKTFYTKNVNSDYAPQQTTVSTNNDKPNVEIAIAPEYEKEMLPYQDLNTTDNSYSAEVESEENKDLNTASKLAYQETQRAEQSPATTSTRARARQYPQRQTTNAESIAKRTEGTNSTVRRSQYSQESQQQPVRRPSVTNRTDRDSKAYAKYQRNRDIQNEQYFEDQKKRVEKSFHVGAKIGVGPIMMYNLGNYADKTSINGGSVVSHLQVKSKFGPVINTGVVVGLRAKKLLIQNETTLQYMKVNFRNRSYTSASSYRESDTYHNSYVYLQTAFHIGGYFDIGETTNLVTGVGPYVAYRLSSSYDKYGIFQKEGYYKEYMKSGQKDIDFGLTSMIGLEMENKYRIALYPSIGLTKMQKEQDYKPFKIELGFTYFFF